MINKNIFREYDIRGVYGLDLNERSVKLIGYYLGLKIKGKKRIAIGYDARSHSPIFLDYLTSGLNAAGCTVLNMGLVATPVNYFANYQDEFDTDASVMITGSHNPSEYNGFKITVNKAPFFGKDIYALGDEIYRHQEKIIADNIKNIPIDVKTKYIDFMVKEFSHLKGMKQNIVIDCGNGVADTVLTKIFDALELNYEGLYCEPDGTFPNHHPDPSEEKNLIDVKKLLAKNGDIAFAYDGDADRIAVLTHKFNIKGDQMALLYAKKIDNPVIVGEVKCSQVMYDELEKRGATTFMYKTGHSNLKVKMKEVDADLACEVSGHIFFKHRYFGYDDAIYATFRMLELIHDGIDLDRELESLPAVYSTEEIKVESSDDKKFLVIDKIKQLLEVPPKDFPMIEKVIDIDGVRIHFENGWALVRASNTTPILVTRFEGSTKADAEFYEKCIHSLIHEAVERMK